MSLTSGLFNPMSRFGFHKQYLLEHSPKYKEREKAECYIPTRLEVFREPAESIMPILENWFSSAPETLTPSAEQKQKVIALLKKRSDAERIAEQIQTLENL